MTPYLATMVMRWHTHPHLSQTNDPVGYHSGRMAILGLDFFGIDGDLLAACLTHDLGEYATGDVPFGSPIKNEHHERIARMQMGMNKGDHDNPRVKFLDLLDSYLWARHHAPALMVRGDWKKQLLTIQDTADRLDVSNKLGEYI
jgi:5'-deoxynucleotidase YfbR-like HD superfamily hydrolase